MKHPLKRKALAALFGTGLSIICLRADQPLPTPLPSPSAGEEISAEEEWDRREQEWLMRAHSHVDIAEATINAAPLGPPDERWKLLADFYCGIGGLAMENSFAVGDTEWRMTAAWLQELYRKYLELSWPEEIGEAAIQRNCSWR